ncbi:hypothetical protein GCM10010156_69050 [Planobispora rosea]|uniref:Uncharacterized protein n=1 Tax=Planobispora rosea TaxID=35762 RepID=A0A8J3S7G7_PLARO|nr:hypothetical protein GCM10010156_69050 [Planobispora rosea]GIH88244.1 hypothetical protein Pro02_66520 [Planobispora rosea]
MASVGAAPPTRPRAPNQAIRPSRTTAAASDGSRDPACSTAILRSSARAVLSRTGDIDEIPPKDDWIAPG